MTNLNTKRTLRKTVILISLLTICFLFHSCKPSDKSRSKVLKIYNWADYIDEAVLTDFPIWYKEQTGEDVRIVYQVFDMTEVMYTKIVLGQEDFDLVCPTQAIIERMINKRLLLPINQDFGKTTNYLSNVSPFIQKQVGTFNTSQYKASEYVISYMWGISGILYNKGLISKEEVQSWKSLWDPKNQGKVLMKDSYWDAYNMAIIYAKNKEIAQGKITLYDAANNHTNEDIELVEKYLKLLKPNLAGWEADFGKEMMTKGKIWMSYAWSGDAVWAIEEAATVNVDLGYEVPLEGSNVWFDGWVIPKYARNTKAAAFFLNYLCRPDIALRNMETTGYTSSIATPEILEEQIDTTLTESVNLSYFFGTDADSLFINPIRYPDSSVIDRCSVIHDFLDKNETVLEMWSRAKGDNLNTGAAVLIFSFFLLLAIWILHRKISRYRVKQRHKRRVKSFVFKSL
ncbi:MAG: ABC transporter substrate-binding protein [Bacteroidota bacterium]